MIVGSVARGDFDEGENDVGASALRSLGAHGCEPARSDRVAQRPERVASAQVGDSAADESYVTRLPSTLAARLHGEDGVTLMELMVAISILAVVMVGFAAGLVNALDLAGGNRNRVIAANILDERMSELRSLDFAMVEVQRGQTTETVERMGLDFQLEQDISWVDEQAAGNACDSPNPSAAGQNQPTYLRVELAVKWPRLADRGEAVESETIINPPVSAYDPYAGHITVKVSDRDAAPVSGVNVYVQDTTSGSQETLTTTSDGCAFFVGLGEGEYTVWVDRAGWVDRKTGLQNPADASPPETVHVTPAVITPVEFNYDEAAFLDLTLQGRFGGTVPSAFPVTVANPTYGAIGEAGFPDLATLAADALYPFAGGYEVWAGACADADPDHVDAGGNDAYPDADRQVFAAEPDTTTTGAVELATLAVTVVSDEGTATPLPGVPVRATDCAATYDLGTTDTSGELLTALPYGVWVVEAEEDDGDWDGDVTVVLEPQAPAAQTVQVEIDA